MGCSEYLMLGVSVGVDVEVTELLPVGIIEGSRLTEGIFVDSELGLAVGFEDDSNEGNTDGRLEDILLDENVETSVGFNDNTYVRTDSVVDTAEGLSVGFDDNSIVDSTVGEVIIIGSSVG